MPGWHFYAIVLSFVPIYLAFWLIQARHRAKSDLEPYRDGKTKPAGLGCGLIATLVAVNLLAAWYWYGDQTEVWQKVAAVVAALLGTVFSFAVGAVIARAIVGYLAPQAKMDRAIRRSGLQQATQRLVEEIGSKGPTEIRLNLLSYAYAKSKDWRKLLALTDDYEQRFGLHYINLANRVLALIRLKQFDQADEVIEQALQISGTYHIGMITSFGTMFLEENEIEKASEMHRRGTDEYHDSLQEQNPKARFYPHLEQALDELAAQIEAAKKQRID